MSGLTKLSDEMLLEVYFKSLELNTDRYFIQMLIDELYKREMGDSVIRDT